jgi:hypothetical protein
MIPTALEMISAHLFLARRFGWEVVVPDDDIFEAVVHARVEARRLAEEQGDEVAAFFYACALESPRLGEDFVLTLILVTRNHARALGREPARNGRALSRDLLLKSREIAGRVLTFPAFRAWLEHQLPRGRA